jgi:hypothetical protein
MFGQFRLAAGAGIGVDRRLALALLLQPLPAQHGAPRRGGL